MTACKDDNFEPAPEKENSELDLIMFTTMMPEVGAKTRSTAQEDWETEVKSYKAVKNNYTFDIEMWREGATEKFASSTYKPLTSTNDEDELLYSADGTLQLDENATPLYWQDNVNKWGFKATAGTATLDADQTDKDKWLAQDRLEGYGYLPIWDEENNKGIDQFSAFNYRTSKEWYADNKKARQLSGLMENPDSEDYKKIPLYLQHQRAWITVILKAGEGVTREALAYATSDANIQTTIYSYKEGEAEPLPIEAWSSEEFVDYGDDKNGDAATGVSTTRYDAIVEPHNFIASRTNEESDIIARVSVSNQKFTFAAANDGNYANFIAEGASSEKEAATAAMQVYNLEAGKHLIITATLSRASRMIMITAWIEDWTETVTQTICDDYGQNGDPILINDVDELKSFLSDPDKNKAGNVGMIVPSGMDLGTDWDGSNYSLKATLNLASTQFSATKQLLNRIERTGSIINGVVKVADTFNGPTAIANVNEGTIERVKVTTNSETSPARASVAGIVGTNYGTVYQCSSALTVSGTNGYVGGIAGTSLYKESGMMPVIDGCTVTARVDGASGVTAGGGIVGQAEGRVSNNTFDYGITLMQDAAKYQNIIAAIGASYGLTTHTNNSWPTTANYTVNGSNNVVIENRNTTARFDAIIDNIDELKLLLESQYNIKDKTYRVANSFPVDKEHWIWGDAVLKDDYFETNAVTVNGTVKFKLDGNDKTITLTGDTKATMLFGSIIGEVYDLNLFLEKPIEADRITSTQNNDDSNADAIAAFAYAVTVSGEAKGVIQNITLKAAEGAYIQSTTPAGIVVWARYGGKIINCASNVPIKMHITAEGSDARHYAGGIVACAHVATISQCKYYADNGIGWEESDGNKPKQSNCRYGGIVGGTSEIANSQETPRLELVDCFSWWQLPTFTEEATVRPVMGSIIGSTVYHDPNDASKLYNAMAETNAGNWWTGVTGAGYTPLAGINEEKAIGKKNSVPPTKPSGW